MSDDMMKDVAKEVAKDVYADTGKPVLKPTGELLGLVPRAIHAALLPIEKWVLSKEYNLEATKRLLDKKLENVPAELIESPEPHIAVPALQYISYCMDNEELRNMYANLLANSMNSVMKNGVHPAFVEIIKQLCPDEAKLMKHIYQVKTVPTIDICMKNKEGGKILLYKNFSNIGKSTGCESPESISSYFDNLIRLGLIEQSPALSSLIDKELYEPLKNDSFIKRYAVKMEVKDDTYERKCDEAYIRITAFGTLFGDICLIDPPPVGLAE